MKKKGRETALTIGRFVITNLFLPISLVYLGHELYNLWFKKN
jgi:hypothetical protein